MKQKILAASLITILAWSIWLAEYVLPSTTQWIKNYLQTVILTNSWNPTETQQIKLYWTTWDIIVWSDQNTISILWNWSWMVWVWKNPSYALDIDWKFSPDSLWIKWNDFTLWKFNAILKTSANILKFWANNIKFEKNNFVSNILGNKILEINDSKTSIAKDLNIVGQNTLAISWDINIKKWAFKDQTIVEEDLADNVINADIIANNAVTNEKIAQNAVTTNKIAWWEIFIDNIKDWSVTSEKIEKWTIRNEDLATDSITYEKIADHTINSTNVNLSQIQIRGWTACPAPQIVPPATPPTKINWVCGTTSAWSCISWTAWTITPNWNTSTWICKWENWGNDSAQCSFTTQPLPAPINWVCWVAEWTCNGGSLENKQTNWNITTWTCKWANGWTSASCSYTAQQPINWICGTANWKTFANSPTTNLCGDWSTPNVSIDWNKYYWTCVWKNNWTNAWCYANVESQQKPDLIIDSIKQTALLSTWAPNYEISVKNIGWLYSWAAPDFWFKATDINGNVSQWWSVGISNIQNVNWISNSWAIFLFDESTLRKYSNSIDTRKIKELIVTVDSNNKIDESNENNNTFTWTFDTWPNDWKDEIYQCSILWDIPTNPNPWWFAEELKVRRQIDYRSNNSRFDLKTWCYWVPGISEWDYKSCYNATSWYPAYANYFELYNFWMPSDRWFYLNFEVSDTKWQISKWRLLYNEDTSPRWTMQRNPTYLTDIDIYRYNPKVDIYDALTIKLYWDNTDPTNEKCMPWQSFGNLCYKVTQTNSIPAYSTYTKKATTIATWDKNYFIIKMDDNLFKKYHCNEFYVKIKASKPFDLPNYKNSNHFNVVYSWNKSSPLWWLETNYFTTPTSVEFLSRYEVNSMASANAATTNDVNQSIWFGITKWSTNSYTVEVYTPERWPGYNVEGATPKTFIWSTTVNTIANQVVYIKIGENGIRADTNQ